MAHCLFELNPSAAARLRKLMMDNAKAAGVIIEVRDGGKIVKRSKDVASWGASREWIKKQRRLAKQYRQSSLVIMSNAAAKAEKAAAKAEKAAAKAEKAAAKAKEAAETKKAVSAARKAAADKAVNNLKNSGAYGYRHSRRKDQRFKALFSCALVALHAAEAAAADAEAAAADAKAAEAAVVHKKNRAEQLRRKAVRLWKAVEQLYYGKPEIKAANPSAVLAEKRRRFTAKKRVRKAAPPAPAPKTVVAAPVAAAKAAVAAETRDLRALFAGFSAGTVAVCGVDVPTIAERYGKKAVRYGNVVHLYPKAKDGAGPVTPITKEFHTVRAAKAAVVEFLMA